MTIVEDGVQRAGIEAAGFVNIDEQDYKVSSPRARTGVGVDSLT